MRADINLLPKRKIKDTSKTTVSFIIALILVALLSAVFLVYLPTKDKIKLQDEIVAKEAELSTYTATKEEYDSLLDRLNLLKSRISAFDNINNNNISKLHLIEDIETAMPTNTTLNSFSFSQDVLSITGTTTSDNPVLVSQIMVNLRNIDRVTSVTLGSFSATQIGYSFSLTINYDLQASLETEEGAE